MEENVRKWRGEDRKHRSIVGCSDILIVPMVTAIHFPTISDSYSSSDRVTKSYSFNSSYLVALKRKILTNYDKEVIPKKGNEPLIVTISVSLQDMYPTEKITMHYSIACYLRSIWEDYRLAVNESDGTSAMPFDHTFVHKIWVPNIYLPKMKRGNKFDVVRANSGAFVYPNGTILLVERLSISAFCDMNLLYFPFDIQKCDFHIETYSYNTKYVILRWQGDKIVRKRKDLYTTDFQHVEISLSNSTVDYGYLFDYYSRLTIHFTLYRYLALYILRDYFPCILIVMLSWVSFWINYRSTPARVALGITTILTSVTSTNTVRGESFGLFRSIDYYMLFCNLFVFAALGEFALVGVTSPYLIQKDDESNQNADNSSSNNHANLAYGLHNDEEFSPLPTIQSISSNKNIAGEWKTKSFPRKKKKMKNGKRKFNRDTDIKRVKVGPFQFYGGDSHIIDRISRVIFPIAFVLLNVVYFLFHRIHPDTVD